MWTDMIVNGQGQGPLAEYLGGLHFEPGLSRPFYDNITRNEKSGSLRWPRERFVRVPVGKRFNRDTGVWNKVMRQMPVKEAERIYDVEVPIRNAQTLTKDVWIEIDSRIQRAPRQRLRLAADIAAAARRTVDGMGKTMIEYNAFPDFGEAIQDMDPVSDTRADRPPLTLKSMPLPVTHSGYEFTQREIAVSRNSGAGALDLVSIEMGGRRVMEMIEKVTIGVETGLTFGPTAAADARYTGTSAVYGATTFPYRVTKTDLTTPLGSNPEATVQDLLEMIETMQTNGYYGPYVLYTSTAYSIWLNSDYFRSGSTSAVRTVRERLMEIEGLSDIRRLDFLTSGYQLLLMQQGADVAEMIDGMGISTIQWTGKGGFKQYIEVIAIQNVLWRSPSNGIAGLIHGTTS